MKWTCTNKLSCIRLPAFSKFIRGQIDSNYTLSLLIELCRYYGREELKNALTNINNIIMSQPHSDVYYQLHSSLVICLAFIPTCFGSYFIDLNTFKGDFSLNASLLEIQCYAAIRDHSR